MRLLLLLALVSGCRSDDKAAKHFCQNVRIVFGEMGPGEIDKARRALGGLGSCVEVNEAVGSLRTMRVSFAAAAVPFRDRSEVGNALDALDKLTLDELVALRCVTNDDTKRPTPDVQTLRAGLDAVEAKLAAVVATCPRP